MSTQEKYWEFIEGNVIIAIEASPSHGHLDAVMMSFSDPAADNDGKLGPVVPQIAFVGVASSIQLFRLVTADE